jgi:hypothetical protein
LLPVTIDAAEYFEQELIVIFEDENGIVFDSKEFTMDEFGIYQFNQFLTVDWKPGKYQISLFSSDALLDIVTFEITQNVFDLPKCDPNISELECSEQNSRIKQWVKQYIELWQFGIIDDSDFNQGLSFLIDQKIVDIPSMPTNSDSAQIPQDLRERSLDWYKNELSDDDFLSLVDSLIKGQRLGYQR